MESDKNERETSREVCANGNSINAAELEAKLDAGNVQEAETTLRDGLSLSSEVHFCLLIEYSSSNNLKPMLQCHIVHHHS